MHILKENLPLTTDVPGMKARSEMGWGGMAVAYFECGPMDKAASAAMFESFPGKSCPVPHWGYLVKGSMHVQYIDGTEEVVKAGEVFYLPAGHTGWSDEAMAWIEFSPEADMLKIAASMPK